MLFAKILILAVIQGLAELLPVSSSAHVVVAEKLLGLDPSAPAMTLLLVMLHTGTMFAVIVYFWTTWRATYFQDAAAFKTIAARIFTATLLTALLGAAIIKAIERTCFRAVPQAQIEDLFGRLNWIAPALAAAGTLILIAGLFERRQAVQRVRGAHAPGVDLTLPRAAVIGMVQGLCLPFRGFSRSGATISAAMLLGVSKTRAESFSFALAVVLTPPVVAREAWRLVQAVRVAPALADERTAVLLSLFGAVIAFAAGMLALRWLSRWLENGRWYFFGVYCWVAAAAAWALYRAGY